MWMRHRCGFQKTRILFVVLLDFILLRYCHFKLYCMDTTLLFCDTCVSNCFTTEKFHFYIPQAHICLYTRCVYVKSSCLAFRVVHTWLSPSPLLLSSEGPVWWACALTTKLCSWASKIVSISCQCSYLNRWTACSSVYILPSTYTQSTKEKKHRRSGRKVQKSMQGNVRNLEEAKGGEFPEGVECGQSWRGTNSERMSQIFDF